MNNVDLNYVATMIENLRHGDDAYYTPETIDSIIAALREQTAPAGTDGGECQHEWVPDVDVSGWVYCHRCDCSRRDPSLRPKATPAGATVEERWDVTSLLRITKTAIEVCNELSRPAMAEDLESVQRYLASALAQQMQSSLSQDSATVSNAAQQPARGVEVVTEYERGYWAGRLAERKALAQPRTEQPAAAYGRVVNGKAVTVSVEHNPANDEPLYAGAPPRADAEVERLVEAASYARTWIAAGPGGKKAYDELGRALASFATPTAALNPEKEW